MLLLAAVLFLANEKEIAMGRAMNVELRERTPAIDDAEITAYVTRIADRFREQSPFPLTVEVTANLSKRQVSALPGGFLRVPLGAILQSQTEAELAFTIAHGVAHFAKQHHRRPSANEDSTIPLVILDSYLHGDQDFMPGAMIPRYREAEREADVLALEWTMDYQPTGEFEAVRNRAKQLVPTRKKPTLRRRWHKP